MYKIGIDVGGTFTDIVLQDEIGKLIHGKVPSRPGNEAEAVIAALALIAEKAGLDLSGLLQATDVINFGTTVATNAMLQNRGVRTAMLTTRGFRDVLELRRGYKEVLFDIKLQAPVPIVAREWRIPITERIGPYGEVQEIISNSEVEAAAKRISKEKIESVAICFLNSQINSNHERQAASILEAICPDVDIHLSSSVLPKIREYERFSTTVVNAYLSPLLRHYLDRLMSELRRHGFDNQLLVMQSNGGTAAPEHAGKLACAALLSGPAGGVAAAARIGLACGAPNVIGVDMGGTSYDVSLIRGGAPETRTESWFNRNFVGIPMLGIHTIGAGGGSIAWVDDGGALRVGPQSAGARPGPACYGWGGTDPTATDVFVHLGYLNPKFFLGGEMQLQTELASDAIRTKIAHKFGMNVTEAAFSIFRILNNHLSNGIRYVSVAEGHDPREFALMSFGGAGSLTACLQARDLGIRRVLVPKMASVFCAFGELLADLRVSQIHSQSGRFETIPTGRIERELSTLADEARSILAKLPDVKEIAIERTAELRYAGQVHELATHMPNSDDFGEDLRQTAVAFHKLHKQRYAFEMPDKPLEIIAIRQDVVGRRHWELPQHQEVDFPDASAAIKGWREVCFPDVEGFQWLNTPIYDGAKIQPGHVIQGPAVIEEVDTTIALQPKDVMTLNRFQVYEIDIEGDINE